MTIGQVIALFSGEYPAQEKQAINAKFAQLVIELVRDLPDSDFLRSAVAYLVEARNQALNAIRH